MRRNTRQLVINIAVVILIFVVSITFGFPKKSKKFSAPYTEYDCDVKNFRLSTTIEIEKEGEEFVEVKGNIFAFITDPLTMYDLQDNKPAYAGDAYHFISQDSHTIYVDNEFSVEMVGLFELFGESYEIYNFDEEKIAKVEFNVFNTRGEMYDEEGTLLAEFSSPLYFNDFTVRISEDCDLDEKTVLMIFSSYYSDQHADRNN